MAVFFPVSSLAPSLPLSLFRISQGGLALRQWERPEPEVFIDDSFRLGWPCQGSTTLFPVGESAPKEAICWSICDFIPIAGVVAMLTGAFVKAPVIDISKQVGSAPIGTNCSNISMEFVHVTSRWLAGSSWGSTECRGGHSETWIAATGWFGVSGIYSNSSNPCLASLNGIQGTCTSNRPLRRQGLIRETRIWRANLLLLYSDMKETSWHQIESIKSMSRGKFS